MADQPVPALAPLRVADYRRVWAAALVSNVGTFLQLVAAPWLMLELTGSPFQVSLVSASLMLPRLLFTIPAGALADLIDRRTVLLTGQLANAVSVAAMALLTWQDLITPQLLVALSFLLGIGTALSLPSFQTLVPDLVPRTLLPAAVTLNSAAFNVARAVGPAIGGALVGAGLAAVAFGANAASYLVIVGILLTLRSEQLPHGRRDSLWRSSATGVRYARFTPSIRLVLLVTAAFSLTAAAVQTLLPNVSSDDLGLGATGFGVLYGLFGGGALVGALTREQVRVRVPGPLLLPGAMAGFGAAGVVFGLSGVPAVSGAALAFGGLCWVWTLTTLNATVQLLSPRWVRGRTMSLYLLSFAGMMPFGALIAGAFAEVVGAGLAVAALSAATLVVGVASRRFDLPVLGDIEEPTAPADWSVPAHAAQVGGHPVLIVTTWEIDPDELGPFLDALRGLRRHRLRTGARRWSVLRDADCPYRITEVVEVHDWDEHLHQHSRIDTDAATAIRRARAFDRAGGPITRHLAGLDLLDSSAPPIEEQLLTVHEELHQQDGSVPLPDSAERPG